MVIDYAICVCPSCQVALACPQAEPLVGPLVVSLSVPAFVCVHLFLLLLPLLFLGQPDAIQLALPSEPTQLAKIILLLMDWHANFVRTPSLVHLIQGHK